MIEFKNLDKSEQELSQDLQEKINLNTFIPKEIYVSVALYMHFRDESILGDTRKQYILNDSTTNRKRIDYICRISDKISKKKEKFPAYFTFLCGHELGHVKIYLYDWYLSIFCDLVRYAIEYTSYKKNLSLIPSERYCNSSGKKLSINVFSYEKFLSDLRESRTESSDILYQLELETVPIDLELNNLEEDSIEFTKSYKNELLEIWNKDKEKIFEDPNHPMNFVTNLREVFNPRKWDTVFSYPVKL